LLLLFKCGFRLSALTVESEKTITTGIAYKKGFDRDGVWFLILSYIQSLSLTNTFANSRTKIVFINLKYRKRVKLIILLSPTISCSTDFIGGYSHLTPLGLDVQPRRGET
jgi:hypothetical protein